MIAICYTWKPYFDLSKIFQDVANFTKTKLQQKLPAKLTIEVATNDSIQLCKQGEDLVRPTYTKGLKTTKKHQITLQTSTNSRAQLKQLLKNLNKRRI